jgi:hypothetical protein
VDCFFRIQLIVFLLDLFTHVAVQRDFHISWCSCRLTVTRRMPLVEQELFHPPKHPSSSIFCDVRVSQSVVFCAVFCKSLYVFFSHFCWSCVVCSSSICGCWLPFWYLQPFLGIFDACMIFTVKRDWMLVSF